MNISTDKGTITVGHTVNSDEGSVNLHSGNGDVLVGKDITAGQDVSITSQQGDVLIGDPITGDDGDILSKAGDVSIRADQNVVIAKTITAQGQEGDIDIASGQGDIIVGNTVNSDEGNVSCKPAERKRRYLGRTGHHRRSGRFHYQPAGVCRYR